ncbi:MAG: N-acetylmuramoyl-L-alanine amidase [Lachnospiraceae bacterium]|nr:N-acetylmuramoyl-L-alanine amidase [Lachnospiraceae bacterium]
MYGGVKRILALILSVAVIVAFAAFPEQGETAYAAEPVVVVIDPGHGGENLGTDYLPIPEKVYTMQVALYMKEELEKYNNVTVYLTHTEDIDMDLDERADFAKSVNADFLFSLHFNMSISHALYGSEVWVPSTGTLYSRGYSAGNEFLMQFEQMGLFNRGIKTRIGSKGTDYYGIIKHCALRDIPAIIVEHCHVDHINDVANIQSQSRLKELGVRDATAVARYFGLVKKDGEADYSAYAPLAVPVPEERVYNDTTAPLYLEAKLLDYNSTSRYATVELNALDYESPLQYYAFSTDNGLTWSTLQAWNKGQNEMTVTVNIGYGKKDSLLFKVMNLYDIATNSNLLRLD